MAEVPGQALADRAMRDAAMLMARTAPGMLPVYMLFRGVPTVDPKVTVRAGISAGGPSLEYNVNFVTALEPSLLGAVIYMQCLKLALHHCDKRKREPLDMLKLASDVVVAEYARQVVDTSVGRNMEIVNRLFPSYWNYWPVLSRHGFQPETDLVLEKLFEIFREEYSSMKPKEERKDSGENSGERRKQKDDARKKTEPSDGDGERTTGPDTADDDEAEGGSPGDSKEESGEDSGGDGRDSGGEEGDGDSGEKGDSGDADDGGEGEEGDDEGQAGEGHDEGGEGGGDPGDDPGEPQDSRGGDGSSGEGADGGSVPDGTPGGEGDGEGPDGPPGDSDGSGEEGTPGDSGEEGDGTSGDSGEGPGNEDDFGAMSRYFSLTSAGSDLSGWDGDPVTRDIATSAVQDALDRGMFDRMRGQLPMMLRNANRVKVDTDRMFRKFMSSVRTDEPVSSWSRRNRKYLRLGRMIAPGYLYRDTQRILFCVDVSGSMMQADAVLECMTVMENAVDGLSIDLVYWDAVCSPVFSRPRTVRDMAIYGGGRTDPGCVLRKLGPELKRYDGLIFLTDCIFEWEEPACARKIMVLRTHGDHEFPAWCRYTDELRNFIGNG